MSTSARSLVKQRTNQKIVEMVNSRVDGGVATPASLGPFPRNQDPADLNHGLAD